MFSACKNMQNVPKRYESNRRRCLKIESLNANIFGIHCRMRMVGQLRTFQLPPQLFYLRELLKD